MPHNISLHDISFEWPGKTLFRNVNLSLTQGEITVLVGRSGIGKSTLLEIAAGLRLPTGGRVEWDSHKLDDLSGYKRNSMRRNIGFVFQQHALISNFTIYNNIALPLKYHTMAPQDSIKAIVDNQIDRFGLGEIANNLPETLSVGQCKLAALARSLILKPSFLFLDEPLAGLDPVTAQLVVDHLIKICSSHDMTIFMVSHLGEIIRKIDPHIALLENQKLSVYTNLDDAITKSEDREFVERLFGKI